MSKALISSSLLSGGVGNGKDVGGVAEEGDWGRGGEIIGSGYIYDYSICRGWDKSESVNRCRLTSHTFSMELI